MDTTRTLERIVEKTLSKRPTMWKDVLVTVLKEGEKAGYKFKATEVCDVLDRMEEDDAVIHRPGIPDPKGGFKSDIGGAYWVL